VQPPEALVTRLDRLVATAQAEQRSPSAVAAVCHDGEGVWRTTVGEADVASGEAASTDHAYGIGSITKTFTAACVLQLRDEGRLELRDPLQTHLPEAPAGPTVADALAHLSGFQPRDELAEADDRWRVAEGCELGELLRVVRDADGRPVKLYLATYPVTRAPAASADSASE
jgi:CubicO group peptidase (beta-lactamase class C family)